MLIVKLMKLKKLLDSNNLKMSRKNFVVKLRLLKRMNADVWKKREGSDENKKLKIELKEMLQN